VLAPEAYLARTGRAEVRLAIGQHEAALADCDRAIELDAKADWAIACRAEAYQNLARYHEALADYNTLLDLDPDDAESLAGRGQTLLAMGRPHEAWSDLTKATDVDPALTTCAPTSPPANHPARQSECGRQRTFRTQHRHIVAP